MPDTIETSDTPVAAEWLSWAKSAERSGDFLAAYDYARRGLEAHPDHLWLKHCAVLTLARSGATDQARALFEELQLARQPEEDIAALDARLAKDRALATDGRERVSRAAAAAELYQAIYQRTGGYYPGINGATMRLLAGQPSEAAELGRRVLESCAEAERRAGGEDYYLAATRAEAGLLLDDLAAADEALRRAAAAHGGNFAAVATTRRQLRLICDVKGLEPGVLAPLGAPRVVHYVGHIFAPPGRVGRLAAEFENSLAERIAARLRERGVGYGYGSLACGADILLAEALLARKAELHVVLPFEVDEFKKMSVAHGGADWLARFDSCLVKATSVSYATEDSYLGDDTLFAYASRFAMGLALLRARYLDTAVEQLAVWDRKPSQNVAGTAVDVAFWQARGLPTEVINCGPFTAGAEKGTTGLAPVDQWPGRVVRAMLFGDIKGFSKLREAELPRFVDEIMGRFATVLDGFGDRVLYRNTWGDAVYIVLPDASTAATCAMDLQAAMNGFDFDAAGLSSDLALRLGGHIGPVFEGRDPVLKSPAFFGAHVSRTARIEPVTPPGEVYVTEPFAAALALTQDSPFRCEYVGYIAGAKDYEAMRMYVVRQS